MLYKQKCFLTFIGFVRIKLKQQQSNASFKRFPFKWFLAILMISRNVDSHQYLKRSRKCISEEKRGSICWYTYSWINRDIHHWPVLVFYNWIFLLIEIIFDSFFFVFFATLCDNAFTIFGLSYHFEFWFYLRLIYCILIELTQCSNERDEVVEIAEI